MIKRKIDTLATYAKLGPKRAMLYGRHMLLVRSGRYLKTLPIGEWGQNFLGTSFFRVATSEDLEQSLCHSEPNRASLLAKADRIAAGELPYFFTRWLKRPEHWAKHPITGGETAKTHWSQIGEFDETVGDIKWIWDASRFEWAYVLGRAFAVSGDEKYSTAFWDLFESWRTENPPNLGINWRCAQECSLRLIALAWSAAAFANSEATTDARLGALWETVYRLAVRIEETLGYGISQNNNHAISEATGLLVASTCLNVPEASRWERIGIEGVSRYVVEQFEPDGSYVLQSVNYQRSAMKVCMIAALAAQEKGRTLSKEAGDRLTAAARMLYNLQDAASGALPNYGANEGSNPMALSECDYQDFRATIQSVAYLTTGKKLYDAGPHDEELLWLFGPDALSAESLNWTRSNLIANDGGYYSLRDDNALAFIRCHTYKTRPLQADMLHIDFWLDGRNIAHDPGTYSYFDPLDTGVYLSETAAHNTVTVDGKSQMDHGRRFLWLNWTRSRLVRLEPDLVAGEHYGYRQIGLGVVHRREMRMESSQLIVTDDLLSDSDASLTFDLRWHLEGSNWRLDGTTVSDGDAAITVSSETPLEVSLKIGKDFLPETAFSRHYGNLETATVLSAKVKVKGSVRLETVVSRQRR